MVIVDADPGLRPPSPETSAGLSWAFQVHPFGTEESQVRIQSSGEYSRTASGSAHVGPLFEEGKNAKSATQHQRRTLCGLCAFSVPLC
jgi:hypothetical protein